jgi:hypothetical protein
VEKLELLISILSLVHLVMLTYDRIWERVAYIAPTQKQVLRQERRSPASFAAPPQQGCTEMRQWVLLDWVPYLLICYVGSAIADTVNVDERRRQLMVVPTYMIR